MMTRGSYHRFSWTGWLLPLVLLLAACGSAPPAEEAAAPAEEAQVAAESAPTEPAEPTASDTTAATSTPEPEPTATAAPTEPADPTTAAPTEPADPTASDTAAATSTPEPEPTATEVPATPTEVPATPTPAGPVTLSAGSFIFIDNLHSAEGTASIVQQPDGTRVLRFDQNFSVTFGPDLFVWLSGHPLPTTEAETINQGYVQLDRLQSRSGTQEYVIPADVNLDNFQSAVVWCEAFRQVMSSATLEAE
jgi:hypothetical protein